MFNDKEIREVIVLEKMRGVDGYQLIRTSHAKPSLTRLDRQPMNWDKANRYEWRRKEDKE